MTEALKPCPFCKCEVRMHMHSYLGEWYTIRGEHAPSCPMRKVWRNYADEAEAIAAWNTRADDYKQAAEYWQRMYEEAFSKRTCHDTDENPWHFTCSACGYEQNGYEQWNYCPNCGAKVMN